MVFSCWATAIQTFIPCERPWDSFCCHFCCNCLNRSGSFVRGTTTTWTHRGWFVSLRIHLWLALTALQNHLTASSSFPCLTRAASLRRRVKYLAVNWLCYLTDPLLRWGFTSLKRTAGSSHMHSLYFTTKWKIGSALFTHHRTNDATPARIIIMLKNNLLYPFIFRFKESKPFLSHIFVPECGFISINTVIKPIMDHLNYNICLRLAKCKRLALVWQFWKLN